VSQVVIENPIINSPFDEPTRHFRFSDDGITDEIVEGRRTSEPEGPAWRILRSGGFTMSPVNNEAFSRILIVIPPTA
jgi:hypothetical protein